MISGNLQIGFRLRIRKLHILQLRFRKFKVKGQSKMSGPGESVDYNLNQIGKRNRMSTEDESEFMPLSKRINNLHLNQNQNSSINNNNSNKEHHAQQNGHCNISGISNMSYQIGNNSVNVNNNSHNYQNGNGIHQQIVSHSTHPQNNQPHSKLANKEINGLISESPPNYLNSNNWLNNNNNNESHHGHQHQQFHNNMNSCTSNGHGHQQTQLNVPSYTSDSDDNMIGGIKEVMQDFNNYNNHNLEQEKLEVEEYNPSLDPNSNPYYYDQNRLLHELHWQRLIRKNQRHD